MGPAILFRMAEVQKQTDLMLFLGDIFMPSWEVSVLYNSGEGQTCN